MNPVATLPTPPAAVLFDLDGTLVDTAPEFVQVIQSMRKARGAPALNNKTIIDMVTHGAEAMLTLITDEPAGSEEHTAIRTQFLAEYEAALGSAAVVYPGLRELIDKLGDAGIRWGVVTNKRRRFAEPLMAAMALRPSDYALVTPCDVAQPKPHPEALERACHQLGVHANATVYVGDHRRDIDAGKAAGCATIAAAYGYLEPGDQAQSWGADRIATCSEALASLLMETMQ